MYTVKTIKSEDIFKTIREVLSRGSSVRITVTGDSMYPFLKPNIDSVVLCHKDLCEIKKGDIVLAIREDGDYILHRVFRTTQTQFYVVGDAQQDIEGPFNPKQLIATVTSVYKANKHFFCSSLYWRLLSYLWLLLLPFRYLIINLYFKFRRLI